jgi:uncharacterized protein with GYD domain
MGKYLLQVKYSAEGARGLLAEGGTSRRDYVTKYVESIGGTVEAFYFGFGTYDAYVIIDGPSDAAVAGSLTVGASGAASIDTVVLLTAEEIDKASARSASYRPPGA